MIDVLVIIMAVVVVTVVVTGRRRKATIKQSRRTGLLDELAPVINGSGTTDGALTGRFGGYDIQVSLRSASPSAPNGPSVSSERYLVEVIEIRVLDAPGGQPWFVWHAHTLPGMTWHFSRSDGRDFLPFLNRLGKLAGLPQADPDLPDRLRAAGVIEAIERLGPPTNDSFPRVRFMPDLRPQMLERMRASGRHLPPDVLEDTDETRARLEVEVERANDHDPDSERFRSILQVVMEIVEINDRANPAGSSPAP